MRARPRLELLLRARLTESCTQFRGQLFHHALQPLALDLLALLIEKVETKADALVADPGLAADDAGDTEHLAPILAAERARTRHLQHHPARQLDEAGLREIDASRRSTAQPQETPPCRHGSSLAPSHPRRPELERGSKSFRRA